MKINKGDLVKIRTKEERFWLKVYSAGKYICGVVNNYLVCTDSHGLNYGDTVHFSRDEILEVR